MLFCTFKEALFETKSTIMPYTFIDFLGFAFVWLEILAFVLSELVDREAGIDHVEERPTQANQDAHTVPLNFYGDSILAHLPKLEKK